MNQAFECYKTQPNIRTRCGFVLRAATCQPTYVTNRGVVSIMLRSMLGAAEENIPIRTRVINK